MTQTTFFWPAGATYGLIAVFPPFFPENFHGQQDRYRSRPQAHSPPPAPARLHPANPRPWPAREPGTWRCYPQQEEPWQALQEGRLKPSVGLTRPHKKSQPRRVGFFYGRRAALNGEALPANRRRSKRCRLGFGKTACRQHDVESGSLGREVARKYTPSHRLDDLAANGQPQACAA